MDFSDRPQQEIAAAKTELRARMQQDRRALTVAQRRGANESMCETLLTWLGHDHLTIAAYSPIGTEPGGELPQQLLAAGHAVLLPILCVDDDLDWASFAGTFATARFGLQQPEGPRLGHNAIGTADVVIVPALAVGRHGQRLGRGGGSYDRALARSNVAPIVAMVYDNEWPAAVPTAAHDRPVSHVITPRRGCVEVVA